MQTVIIIFVSWLIPILFALINIYRKMSKGSTIKYMFSKLQWPILIPIFNIVILVIYIAMSVGRWFLNIRIK